MNPRDSIFKILKNKYFLIAILFLICVVTGKKDLDILFVLIIVSLLFDKNNTNNGNDVYGGDSDFSHHDCGHHNCGHHGDGCDH